MTQAPPAPQTPVDWKDVLVDFLSPQHEEILDNLNSITNEIRSQFLARLQEALAEISKEEYAQAISKTNISNLLKQLGIQGFQDLGKQIVDKTLSLDDAQFAQATSKTNLSNLLRFQHESMSLRYLEKIAGLNNDQFTQAIQSTEIALLIRLAKDLDRLDLAKNIIEKLLSLSDEQFTQALRSTSITNLERKMIQANLKDRMPGLIERLAGLTDEQFRMIPDSMHISISNLDDNLAERLDRRQTSARVDTAEVLARDLLLRRS